MKMNSNSYFTDIIFYKLTFEQKKNIHNFMNIFKPLYSINYTIIDDFLELKKISYQQTGKNIFFVTEKSKYSQKIINLGYIFHLSYNSFLLNFNKVFQFKNPKEKTLAILAFLSNEQNIILKNLLSFFGLDILIVHNKNDFFQSISINKKKHSLLIFDTDLSSLNLNDKENLSMKSKLLTQLKKVKNQNLNLSTILIKDFSKGNFYEDIILPVKEITNVILNFNELNLFLMQFLYLYQYSKYHATIEVSKNYFDTIQDFYKNEKSNITHKLINIKETFDLVSILSVEKIYNIQKNNFIQKRELILKIKLLKSYYKHLLLHNNETDTNETRESFIFHENKQSREEILNPRKINIQKEIKKKFSSDKDEKQSINSKNEFEKIHNANISIQKDIQSALDKMLGVP